MARTFYLEELDKTGLNPYEAVIASSREARRLNTARLMADAPEGPEKITTIALDRVVSSKVETSYPSEDVETSDEQADSKESSAGS